MPLPPPKPIEESPGISRQPVSHPQLAVPSGQRVRVAVVDSGIHPGHPHIGAVSGGVGFTSPDGPNDDYLDRLGHGTAVAAAIREKAPDADLYAVKIFDRTLSTSIERLIAAIGWAIDSGIHIINLSLGTSRREHQAALTQLVVRAAAAGSLIVAAAEDDGVEWLPGALPGVIGVGLDWNCPRDEYRIEDRHGRPVFFASGYPRSIPGVPPSRNLNGVSFAVANMSGFLSRRAIVDRPWTFEAAVAALRPDASTASVTSD